MRGTIGALVAFFAVAVSAHSLAHAQVVIGNPAKPKAANAGRVVTPEEVAVISDERTSDFYFKWPNLLATGPDGSLFIREVDQLLWFDKGGKFLGNLFKKGQGPGEMSYPGTPLSADAHVVVFSTSPNKLIYFDAAGRYEKEIAVRSAGGRIRLSLIGYQAGRFYFESGEFPRTTGDPDFFDNPRTIVAANEADGSVTSLATFVTRAWVVTSPAGGGGMFPITSLITVPFAGDLFVLIHTEDYLIKLYDPAANKIVREFRRSYERVKGIPLTEAEKKGGMSINGKHYTRPERKFENDIKNLLVRDGEIWAVTSTKDKAKGVLIDVFDRQGVYRDCFWLKVSELAQKGLRSPGQCILDGETLWVAEGNVGETYSVKKYRIVF
jgi:hypothetical protein